MGKYWKVVKIVNKEETESTILDGVDLDNIIKLLERKIEDTGEYYGKDYQTTLKRLKSLL